MSEYLGEHTIYRRELPRFKYKHEFVRDVIFFIYLGGQGYL